MFDNNSQDLRLFIHENEGQERKAINTKSKDEEEATHHDMSAQTTLRLFRKKGKKKRRQQKAGFRFLRRVDTEYESEQ